MHKVTAPPLLLYNFAAQILLFKIELDPNIKKIISHPTLPGPIKCADPFLHESNRETGNCDCFADDNSVLTLFDFASISALKNILGQFRILSGLSTNYEKTAIMRIGHLQNVISDELKDIGFEYVDKIKLLGFVITNEDNISNLNFEPVTAKISNIVKFWERFYLSLSGRITVYKTLLLPQINYFASILTPSDHNLANLSSIMESFVCKGFNIARDRLYKTPSEGGLGMFRLDTFIKALAMFVDQTYFRLL
jgi:ethanolamine utilization protein EutA (predicted chaperonin)